MKHIVLLGIVLGLTIGCSPVSVILPAPTVGQMSLIKKEIATSPRPLPTRISDSAAQRRIMHAYNRVYPSALRICRHIGQDECTWRLSYLADSELNAYASGEDKIVIMKGIVDYAPTDDELAFVVSHEMSHHIANHISESQGHAALGALILGAIAAYATKDHYYSSSSAQQLVSDSAELGAHIGSRSYSKQQEREADYLAAYILAGAGYDIEKAGDVLLTLAKSNEVGVKRLQGFIGTHPSGPERLANWRLVSREIRSTSATLPKLRKRF